MSAEAGSAQSQVESILEELVHAHALSCELPRPSARYSMDESTAYEVQRRFIGRTSESGPLEVTGYKISMVGKEEQELFRTNERRDGRLYKEKTFRSNHTFELGALPYPLLMEPEIAFKLVKDVRSAATLSELAASAEIAPAVEFPALMYRDWTPMIDFLDLICANALSGFLILGEFSEKGSVLLEELITVEVCNGDRRLIAADTSGGMGNPVRALKWLSEKLQASGDWLRKGDIVSSGTLGGARRMRPGQYRAKFAGLGQINFTVTS